MLKKDIVLQIVEEPDEQKRIDLIKNLTPDELTSLAIYLLEFYKHPNPTKPCADV